jgi:hypothetical protein
MVDDPEGHETEEERKVVKWRRGIKNGLIAKNEQKMRFMDHGVLKMFQPSLRLNIKWTKLVIIIIYFLFEIENMAWEGNGKEEKEVNKITKLI